MDPLEVIARLGGDNPPTDNDLSSAVDELKAALDAATNPDNPDVEAARDLREALNIASGEQKAREEAREAIREEARKLREGVFDDDAEKEPTEEEAAEVVAEAEKAAAEAPEPVTAAPAISVIERLRRHAQRVTPEEAEKPSMPGVDIRPVGPAAGFELDQDAGFSQVGQMFSAHAKSLTTAGKDASLLRLTRHYDESRSLGPNVDLNNRKISDVLGPDALPITAAGGFCGPGDVDHSHPICAERGRPIRDGMIQFNATRGRVSFAPAAGLGDLAGNVSIWTAATDADPGEATKPCPPVECPEELSCEVDAIVRCITVGNFQARFSPEFWASRLELLLAEFDRAAEQKALQEIHAASTLLTAVDEGNIITSFLGAINRVIASDRSINRNLSGRYTVIADSWVRDAMRNQVLLNLGVANNVDAIQVADAQINGWLTQLGVTVIWTQDGTVNETSGEHNLQEDPNAFLAETTVYVYPSEAFMFLDGGTLDLGTSITDSALNATNDRQAFAESFEKVCFRGCSAYAVPITVNQACGCPVTAGA